MVEETAAKQDDFYVVQGRHAKRCAREAVWVGATWVAALIYCGVTFALLGYRPLNERGEPELLFGMPSWVVWGLFTPWFVLIGVAWLFAVFLLRDDEPLMDFPKDARDTDASSKPPRDGTP